MWTCVLIFTPQSLSPDGLFFFFRCSNTHPWKLQGVGKLACLNSTLIPAVVATALSEGHWEHEGDRAVHRAWAAGAWTWVWFRLQLADLIWGLHLTSLSLVLLKHPTAPGSQAKHFSPHCILSHSFLFFSFFPASLVPVSSPAGGWDGGGSW